MSTHEAAAGKAKGPGIFLVVVGFLNVLAGLVLLGIGVMAMALPGLADKATAQMSPAERQKFEADMAKLKAQSGQSFEQQMRTGGVFYLIWGVLSLLGSIVTILGGFKMMSLSSYGLAMAGAISALLPCVSPCSCGIIGLAAGIWSIIVLMNADVKAAFR